MKENSVFDEIKAIGRFWPMWSLLASQDIRLRYRRSALGPLWITISMTISICVLGFLYAHLFKINMPDYFPYLASGIIAWSLIGGLVNDSCQAFLEATAYIKNQPSHLTIYLMRAIMRNLLIFAHNLVVYIPIAFIFHVGFGINSLAFIPGLILLSIIALVWGMVISSISTRYRDFNQITSSLLQVVYFATPIMWKPEVLPIKYQWIKDYNPFYHLLNLIRAPMLNQSISYYSLAISLLIALIGFGFFALVIKKQKHLIVYWV